MRDSDPTRTLPRLVRPLLDLLRSGEPVFQKDTLEYQFRRVQFEILNRIPVNEAFRNLVPPMFGCMLHILRHDNEENGINACKTMVELIRGYRVVTEENLTEFVAIFQETLKNTKEIVHEYFEEDSPIADSNVAFPASKSFKALGELGMVMVIMSQIHRNLVISTMQGTTPHVFEVLALESPVQHKAREDLEAMGGFWAGVSPSIRNQGLYSDFIQAQIKVLLSHLYQDCCSSILLLFSDAFLSRLCDAVFWRVGRLIWGNSYSRRTTSSPRLPFQWYFYEKGRFPVYSLHINTFSLRGAF